MNTTAQQPNGSSAQPNQPPAPTAKAPSNKSRKTLAKPRANLRRRGPKPYVVMTLDEAMALGRGIIDHGAGHPMKRVTLLEKLQMTDSKPTRNLIINSGRYQITDGGYHADEIKLTAPGALAVDPAVPLRQKAQARFDLGIRGVPAFFKLYDRFKGSRVPAPEVMRDALEELDRGDRPQCVDIFLSNAKTVGLLKTIEGATHLLPIETLLNELPSAAAGAAQGNKAEKTPTSGSGNGAPGKEDFERVCFFIAPIGEEGSEQRQHSDAILASFVEPALPEHRLKVVRADKITKPGMISAQVIEYIIKSKLVVVDMSFHNPNVFYELCLRHVTGKPTVHIIRQTDKIPFDVANFRTVALKMDTVYSVLANLETYRAEIAQQIRQVITDGVSTNNPILAYCPTAKFSS